MYEEHPAFESPENKDAKIWRYMDFAKFVSLLDKSALFFPRADKLEDPFEGVYSEVNIKSVSQKQREILIKLKEATAVNSWHMNDYESTAMWKIYLKSNEGIAIQSTYNRLKNSFKDTDCFIYIGVVKYIDYKLDWIPEDNLFYPLIYKRKSFEYEHELRAVALPKIRDGAGWSISLTRPLSEEGIYATIDIDTLIEKIYLAPTCPDWLFELVKSIASKYRVNAEILHSSLDDSPVY